MSLLQQIELFKKLKATDDIAEGDKILAQMDELNKQQNAVKQKRMDIAKEAYTKDKDLKGKYAKEDADFDADQMKKDIKAAQDLGHESIKDVAEFLGLDEDEVRETIGGSTSKNFNTGNKAADKILSGFDEDDDWGYMTENYDSFEEAWSDWADGVRDSAMSMLDSDGDREVSKAVTATKNAMKKEFNKRKKQEKHNSKEDTMKVEEFFNKMGEVFEEKFNACKGKMNEKEDEEVDDDDKFEMDGETYSKKELVNAWKEKKNAEESEEKSDEESEEESKEKSDEDEKQNSGDEFFNAMEKRMQQQANANDKIEIYSQAKGLEKGRSIYTK